MKQDEFDFEAKSEAAAAPKSEASAAMIERIKKLLRLAADKRGNPHEAERALQAAYELAERHRVDVAGLDLDESTEKLIHERWRMGMRFDRFRRGITGVLESYFHVTVILDKPELIVVGKATDVLIAHYVHDFLLRAGRNCLSAYEQSEKSMRRRVSGTKRANYTYGFICGLHRMLRGSRGQMHLSDAQNALVVAEDRDRAGYVVDNFKTEKLKALPEARRNDSALKAGFRDGKNTTINQPLNSGRGPLLLRGGASHGST